jgi:alkylation response protein AidB-like acyl-CoA dehydrogenase
LEDQCVITRHVSIAGGVFAPGHLGELTQIVPFEMVDQRMMRDAKITQIYEGTNQVQCVVMARQLLK